MLREKMMSLPIWKLKIYENSSTELSESFNFQLMKKSTYEKYDTCFEKFWLILELDDLIGGLF